TEWLTSQDIAAMMEWLRGEPCEETQIDGLVSFVRDIGKGLRATLAPPPRFADRKWRLFNCSCCRGIWPLIKNAQCEAVVDTGEKWADGQVGEWSRREAAAHAEELYHSAGQGSTNAW